MSRHNRATTQAAAERSLIFATCSRTLQYPDEILTGQLGLLTEVTAAMGPRARAPLARFLYHLETTDLLALQSDYVATFDLVRRNCLYLTYYLNGDTRRRGMALWRFQDAYRSRGLAVAGGELPDFLPVVLELAATEDEDLALALLFEHRQGIEVLRQSLDDRGSPYADVIRALEAALPEPTPEIIAAALTLASEGPPAEQVGLEPFFPVESIGVRS